MEEQGGVFILFHSGPVVPSSIIIIEFSRLQSAVSLICACWLVRQLKCCLAFFYYNLVIICACWPVSDYQLLCLLAACYAFPPLVHIRPTQYFRIDMVWSLGIPKYGSGSCWGCSTVAYQLQPGLPSDIRVIYTLTNVAGTLRIFSSSKPGQIIVRSRKKVKIQSEPLYFFPWNLHGTHFTCRTFARYQLQPHLPTDISHGWTPGRLLQDRLGCCMVRSQDSS